MNRGDEVFINGDGSTSRDFCFVANVVQANLRAALADDTARDQVYNVAVGGRTDLNDLFATLRDTLAQHGVRYDRAPVYRDFRAGDVRHSQADVSKARQLLGYEPRVTMREGVGLAMPWYVGRLG